MDIQIIIIMIILYSLFVFLTNNICKDKSVIIIYTQNNKIVINTKLKQEHK